MIRLKMVFMMLLKLHKVKEKSIKEQNQEINIPDGIILSQKKINTQ
jgi:hypothetical protein